MIYIELERMIKALRENLITQSEAEEWLCELILIYGNRNILQATI